MTFGHCSMSSGWYIIPPYVIRMSYDNVNLSSGWHTLPLLSHPDEIANFDFPQHAVALQRFRTNQRKHQSSASLAFVHGIYHRPVNSPHKWQVKRFHLMTSSCHWRCAIFYWTDPDICRYESMNALNRTKDHMIHCHCVCGKSYGTVFFSRLRKISTPFHPCLGVLL